MDDTPSSSTLSTTLTSDGNQLAPTSVAKADSSVVIDETAYRKVVVAEQEETTIAIEPLIRGLGDYAHVTDYYVEKSCKAAILRVAEPFMIKPAKSSASAYDSFMEWQLMLLKHVIGYTAKLDVLEFSEGSGVTVPPSAPAYDSIAGKGGDSSLPSALRSANRSLNSTMTIDAQGGRRARTVNRTFEIIRAEAQKRVTWLESRAMVTNVLLTRDAFEKMLVAGFSLNSEVSVLPRISLTGELTAIPGSPFGFLSYADPVLLNLGPVQARPLADVTVNSPDHAIILKNRVWAMYNLGSRRVSSTNSFATSLTSNATVNYTAQAAGAVGISNSMMTATLNSSDLTSMFTAISNSRTLALEFSIGSSSAEVSPIDWLSSILCLWLLPRVFLSDASAREVVRVFTVGVNMLGGRIANTPSMTPGQGGAFDEATNRLSLLAQNGITVPDFEPLFAFAAQDMEIVPRPLNQQGLSLSNLLYYRPFSPFRENENYLQSVRGNRVSTVILASIIERLRRLQVTLATVRNTPAIAFSSAVRTTVHVLTTMRDQFGSALDTLATAAAYATEMPMATPITAGDYAGVVATAQHAYSGVPDLDLRLTRLGLPMKMTSILHVFTQLTAFSVPSASILEDKISALRLAGAYKLDVVAMRLAMFSHVRNPFGAGAPLGYGMSRASVHQVDEVLKIWGDRFASSLFVMPAERLPLFPMRYATSTHQIIDGYELYVRAQMALPLGDAPRSIFTAGRAWLEEFAGLASYGLLEQWHAGTQLNADTTFDGSAPGQQLYAQDARMTAASRSPLASTFFIPHVVNEQVVTPHAYVQTSTALNPFQRRFSETINASNPPTLRTLHVTGPAFWSWRDAAHVEDGLMTVADQRFYVDHFDKRHIPHFPMFAKWAPADYHGPSMRFVGVLLAGPYHEDYGLIALEVMDSRAIAGIALHYEEEEVGLPAITESITVRRVHHNEISMLR